MDSNVCDMLYLMKVRQDESDNSNDEDDDDIDGDDIDDDNSNDEDDDDINGDDYDDISQQHRHRWFPRPHTYLVLIG